MHLGLEGRKALVLASSQGLGLAVAQRLAGEGALVVLTGRSSEKLGAAVDGLNRSRGIVAASVTADLSDASGYDAMLEEAEGKFGAFDILINNTGGPAPSQASAVEMATWESAFRAMALPVFEISRRLVAGMRERRWGRIVTIASSGVLQPIPNLPVSNALRSAILAWLKTLSGEVAPSGVTVNVVLPGRIATARTDAIDRAAAERANSAYEAVVEASRATIPLGRYGRPEEFASVVAFLASEPASYVTGSVVRVDGGLIRSV